MTNAEFMSADLETRKNNIKDTLAKKSKNMIAPEVLDMVVDKIDLKRLKFITLTTEKQLIETVKPTTTIYLENGAKTNVKITWVRTLLGRLDLGSKLVINDDGEEVVKHNKPTTIVQTPVIVQVEEQQIGDLDSNSTQIYILTDMKRG